MKMVARDQGFWNDCQGHQEDKIWAGYYLRTYGVHQSVNTKDSQKRRMMIKTPRREIEGEGS